MGEQQGAHPVFFTRKENRAAALPPPKARTSEINLKYPNFPLRLFCYRVNQELVILFNGGAKTSLAVQNSQDLNLYFIQANEFVRRLEDAFQSGMIRIDANDSRLLKDFNGNSEIFI